MSEPVAAAAKLGLMETVIRGRVEGSRRYDNAYFTRVLTPAVDAYSRPQLLELRSPRQVGSKGEEVTVRARLGGFARKAFRATDKDTGEVTTIQPVAMTLDVVE